MLFGEELLAFSKIDHDIFLVRMQSAFKSLGVSHPSASFYVVNENGVLYIQGASALYCGALQDIEEIESFLSFLKVENFKSNNMLLPNWQPVPQYLMHLAKGEGENVFVAEVDKAPDLWRLAHSNVLENINPDTWYAIGQKAVNAQMADIRAIRVKGENGNDEYVSTAGVYAIGNDAVYVSCVATKKEYRSLGYGCTLLSSISADYADKNIYLICKPSLRKFYEMLGYRFARPICEYVAR